MANETCTFSQPIYWDNTDNVFRPLTGNPVHFVQGQNWNYSVWNCTSTGVITTGESTTTLELIQNSTTKAEFNLRKELSYGDVLVITFLLLFAIFGIIKSLGDYWLPKKIDFKR